MIYHTIVSKSCETVYSQWQYTASDSKEQGFLTFYLERNFKWLNTWATSQIPQVRAFGEIYGGGLGGGDVGPLRVSGIHFLQ